MSKFGEEELTPKPPKPEFAGRVAEPQMMKIFLDLTRQTSQALGKFPEQVRAFNKEVQASGGYLNLINQTLGPWWRLITVPIQGVLAFDKGLQVVETGVKRVLAGLGAVAVGGVQGFMRLHNFLSSFGSLHKQTYHKIFEDHNMFVAGVLAGTKTVQHLARGLFDLVTLRAFRRVGEDTQNFNKSVKTSAGLLGKLTGSIGRLGVEMAAAFGVVGIVYKVVQFFEGGTKAAAELNATVTRSKAVFGDSFSAIDAQAEKLTRSSGVAKQAQIELAAEIGSAAQGAGVGEQAAADLSNQLTSLAVDFTALNVPIEEVSEAIKTGLSGRAVSLRTFGAQIDETTVKAYAFAHGIATSRGELNSQQTIMARAGLVMQGLGYAQGAMARAANTASVQFQVAGGGIKNFAEKIGEIMLPMVQAATVGFNALMGTVLDMTASAGPTLKAWATEGSGVITEFIAKIKEFGPTVVANINWAWEEAKKGPLGFVIEGVEAIAGFAKAIPEAIGIAVRNADTLWEIAKLEVGAFVTNAIAWVRTLPANFGPIWDWLGRNWFNLLTDMASALQAVGTNLLTNASNLGSAIWEALKTGTFEFSWTPLLDGFKATTEQLPELIKPALVSVDDEVAKLYEKIGQNEIKRPKLKGAPEDLLGGKKPIQPAEAKTSEYKLGGALEAGSKEAFSAISKGQSGRSSTTDAVKQGVAVQKDIHTAITQQTQVIKDKAFMPALSLK